MNFKRFDVLDAASIAAAADMLEGVAEGARAFWGRVLPDGVAPEVAKQFRHSMDQPHVPPRGLPALNLPKHIRTPGSVYPGELASGGCYRASSEAASPPGGPFRCMGMSAPPPSPDMADMVTR